MTTKKREDEEARETTLVVELAAARLRHAGWALAGLVIGGVMIARMGEIGLILGGAVVLGGLLAAKSFVMSVLHDPGAIAVREGEVLLPTEVCSGKTKTVPMEELRHAYLLRRALPWNHTGPVLVVETRQGVFQYPRDWFAGEHDQRRVYTALNRRLGRLT